VDTNTRIAATLSLSWPGERRELVQRAADAGPATLPVPTLDAFVARKTATYMDRRAPRDLLDLASLAQLGPFAVNVAELFTALCPVRSLPSASTIPAAPEQSLSQRDLAHQTCLTITAAIARETVIDVWANVGRRQGATGWAVEGPGRYAASGQGPSTGVRPVDT